MEINNGKVLLDILVQRQIKNQKRSPGQVYYQFKQADRENVILSLNKYHFSRELLEMSLLKKTAVSSFSVVTCSN